MTPFDQFFHEKKEPIKGCLLALKTIITNYHPEIEPRWYYNYPCFMYQNQIFCYLWIDRKSQQPYIAIGKGIEIDHPALIKAKRTFSSQLLINPNEDIPVDTIHEIFNLAMGLYK